MSLPHVLRPKYHLTPDVCQEIRPLLSFWTNWKSLECEYKYELIKKYKIV